MNIRRSRFIISSSQFRLGNWFRVEVALREFTRASLSLSANNIRIILLSNTFNNIRTKLLDQTLASRWERVRHDLTEVVWQVVADILLLENGIVSSKGNNDIAHNAIGSVVTIWSTQQLRFITHLRRVTVGNSVNENFLEVTGKYRGEYVITFNNHLRDLVDQIHLASAVFTEFR